MRHIADRAGLAIVDEVGAEERAQAVRGNERCTKEGASVGCGHGDAVAVIIVGRDHGIRHQLDLGRAPAGIEQHVMQVDAVDDDVGILEARAERRPGRDAHELLAGEGVTHQRGGRAIRLVHHRVADPDAVQHMEDIRPELDAVADGAEFRRAFEHAALDAVACERERGGQPTKPAADDQNGITGHGSRLPSGPRCRTIHQGGRLV